MGLVEMLVALTVAALILSGVAYGLIRALWTTRDSNSREVAAQLASEAIDQARGTTDVPNLAGTTYTKSVDGTTYTVVRTISTYLSNGATSPCDGSGNASVKYKKIAIRVTWPQMAPGTKSVRADTLLTPSASVFDPSKGNVAVKVLDAKAKPVEGVMVRAAGSVDNDVQYTDDSGCAFFDGVTPDAYTVTASLTNYVSRAGLAMPTASTTVTSGNTSSVAFDYDLAGSLNITLGDSSYPAPANVPVALYNTALLPDGTTTYAGTGTTRTLSTLFPFASGYSVWAGSCVDADPAGLIGGTTPYHVGGVRPAAVTTSATGAPGAAVEMAKLRVVVLDNLGVPIVGAQVQAAHGGSATCDATESYVLGSTDGGGSLKASLPWGTWNFTVLGRTVTTPVTPSFDPTTSEIYVEVRVS
jgi:type II secretory pathway pseudopilin PulG